MSDDEAPPPVPKKDSWLSSMVSMSTSIKKKFQVPSFAGRDATSPNDENDHSDDELSALPTKHTSTSGRIGEHVPARTVASMIGFASSASQAERGSPPPNICVPTQAAVPPKHKPTPGDAQAEIDVLLPGFYQDAQAESPPQPATEAYDTFKSQPAALEDGEEAIHGFDDPAKMQLSDNQLPDAETDAIDYSVPVEPPKDVQPAKVHSNMSVDAANTEVDASAGSSGFPSFPAETNTVQQDAQPADVRIDMSTDTTTTELESSTELSKSMSVDTEATATIVDGVVVITKQPLRRKSKRASRNTIDEPLAPVSAEPVLQGTFVELFTIGGGAHWVLALIYFVLEIFVVLKHAGVVGAGQCVDLFNAQMESPCVGALLKFVLGGTSRHSYKAAGAKVADHPPLETYFSNLGKEEPPADASIFPQRINGQRGTPEFYPITDFDHALTGNERGPYWDLILNGGARGFNVRFKTGMKSRGGESIFSVARKYKGTCFGTVCRGFSDYLVHTCKTNTKVCCPCCCGTKKPSSMNEVQVQDAHGSMVGHVRRSIQGPSTCCATRFSKIAKPAYDVLDDNNNILYTLLVPITKYQFCGCCCDAYADQDFVSIVPGPYNDETIYAGVEHPEKTGWILAMQPRFARMIDNCLARLGTCFKVCFVLTCGLIKPLSQLLKIINAGVTLLRSCPIDNVTQVPHPGTDNMRCALPCSHGMAAQRLRFPEECASESDRMLLIAAALQMDMDNFHLTL